MIKFSFSGVEALEKHYSNEAIAKAFKSLSKPSQRKVLDEKIRSLLDEIEEKGSRPAEIQKKRTNQNVKRKTLGKMPEKEESLSTILERLKDSLTNPGFVKFNVGGEIITASIETLAKEPSSSLYAFGSGLVANYSRDSSGTMFLDRNPKYFGAIIEYLRSGWYNKEGGNYFLKQLYNEANYFGITSLVKELGGIPIDSVFDLQPQETKALTEWCEAESFTLLHRASRDGFESKSFHDHCDNIKGTLTIIKTVTGYIFGGYTEVGWKSDEQPTIRRGSGHEFLYSLRNPQSTDPIQFPVRYFNRYNSVLHCNRYGPSFGTDGKERCEMKIAEDPNTTIGSHVLGFPAMYDGKGYDNKIFCGSDRFQVEDYEVFLVTNQRTRNMSTEEDVDVDEDIANEGVINEEIANEGADF